MLSPAHLRANVLVKLGELTGRTHVLPMVLFAPTARCNSRCLSCDWWRADGKTDLAFSEIAALAKELPRFGTRLVVFTGGEPLLRPDVMEIADLFLRQGLALDLLTSGLALEKFAAAIAARFRSVTVSLDGPTAETYRAIRGVNGLEAVTAGVRRLRALAPQMSITARSTISRHNFRLLPELIVKSREMGLDQISFLTADVTSDAFNRPRGLPQVDAAAPPPASPLLLDEDDVGVFAELVESVIRTHADDFRERRIVPGPEGMRRLVATCRAHLGQGPFPAVGCNAPWTSVVIEAHGAVRPCFFHPAVGNIRERPLAEILNDALPDFRRGLDVATNPTCQRCVCTLKVGLRTKLW